MQNAKLYDERLRNISDIFFDFDGVFTDNKVYVDVNGIESVRCDRSDSLGIDFLKKSGVAAHILSTETSDVVLVRANKLKIPVHHGCADKASFLFDWSQRIANKHKVIAFMGNDLNDFDVMKLAFVSAAPIDAHPKIKQIASIIVPFRGGEGAVRAFCDLVVAARSEV
jgi:3-deoxy-D-manno-octulosonate 8-phosphate phosphatase (KDO 8-P phosphatase)